MRHERVNVRFCCSEIQLQALVCPTVSGLFTDFARSARMLPAGLPADEVDPVNDFEADWSRHRGWCSRESADAQWLDQNWREPRQSHRAGREHHRRAQNDAENAAGESAGRHQNRTIGA